VGDEYVEYPEEDEEDITFELDDGEMLVLGRTLNSQRSEKEVQRQNIFHSHCIVQGKVCSLIIVRGSCANVVSISMIEKISLQTSIHPHSCNIQWLNQNKGLRVTSRCLISFSIGNNYQDELWFDVIPMDVYHLLLGRPCMFDRKVLHDGYLNTYLFTKDGKKITLSPLAPSQLPTNSSTKSPNRLNLFLTFSEPQLKASPHKFKSFTNSEPTPPTHLRAQAKRHFNQMNTLKI